MCQRIGGAAAVVISFTARRRSWPMLGSVKQARRPSGVIRNADWYVPSVTQKKVRSMRPT
jgi:hypothetical protein